MKFVIKKIPKLAIYFYLLGGTVLLISISNFFLDRPFMSSVLTQQVFLAGAIVVALGSVVNILFQFTSNRAGSRNRED